MTIIRPEDRIFFHAQGVRKTFCGLLCCLALRGRAAPSCPAGALPPVQRARRAGAGGVPADAAMRGVPATRARAGRRARLRIEQLARASIAPSSIAIRAASSWCAPRSSAIDITEAALKRALAENFLLKRTQDLADLGVKITVLQTPAGLERAPRPQARCASSIREGTYDFNHVYLDSGVGAGRCRARRRRAVGATRMPAQVEPRRVGLIDGGVDAAPRGLPGRAPAPFRLRRASVPSDPRHRGGGHPRRRRRPVDEIVRRRRVLRRCPPVAPSTRSRRRSAGWRANASP